MCLYQSSVASREKYVALLRRITRPLAAVPPPDSLADVPPLFNRQILVNLGRWDPFGMLGEHGKSLLLGTDLSITQNPTAISLPEQLVPPESL